MAVPMALTVTLSTVSTCQLQQRSRLRQTLGILARLSHLNPAVHALLALLNHWDGDDLTGAIRQLGRMLNSSMNSSGSEPPLQITSATVSVIIFPCDS